MIAESTNSHCDSRKWFLWLQKMVPVIAENGSCGCRKWFLWLQEMLP
jgi:hypothetical protein